MKNMDQENVLRNMDLLSRGFLMLHMLLLFLFFMSGAYIMIVVSLITVLIVASASGLPSGKCCAGRR